MYDIYFRFSLHILTCIQAYYRGWRPPDYVFITHGWYSNGWWEQGNGNASCTKEIMRKMVNNSIAIIPDEFLLSDDKTLATTSRLVRM